MNRAPHASTQASGEQLVGKAMMLLGAAIVLAAAIIIGVPSPQTTPSAAAQATPQLGGTLILIDVDAVGEEQRRTQGRWVGIDYANGTPREIVITQLEDPLFANGFDQ